MGKLNKIFIFLGITVAMLLSGISAMAQGYSGERFYDGEHKNVISGYVMGGSNVVTGGFGGLSGTYVRHFTPRWHLAGDGSLELVLKLTCAFSRYDRFEGDITVRVAHEGTVREVPVPRPYDRAPLLPFQLL